MSKCQGEIFATRNTGVHHTLLKRFAHQKVKKLFVVLSFKKEFLHNFVPKVHPKTSRILCISVRWTVKLWFWAFVYGFLTFWLVNGPTAIRAFQNSKGVGGTELWFVGGVKNSKSELPLWCRPWHHFSSQFLMKAINLLSAYMSSEIASLWNKSGVVGSLRLSVRDSIRSQGKRT